MTLLICVSGDCAFRFPGLLDTPIPTLYHTPLAPEKILEKTLDMTDDQLMLEALGQARKALLLDEVPIGAVVVFENQIIGRGFNQTISGNDPTAHAEIVALRQAATAIGNYRLIGAILYTTIEPCVMCAGALVNARTSRLVYGAIDPRFGAVVTNFQVCDSRSLNHQLEITGGVLETECRELIQSFFKAKRL
jgi:tRNA(adenine34) deaminase